jgi:tRNA/tmRNA/rRNA uracil-C5-methylase (TrmA/RlmC/RlmD family)
VSAAPGRTQRREARRGGLIGRELELTVGAVANGGSCVARTEGRVVFVRHALPGEQVVARVTEDRAGSFLRADAVRVLAASPDRVQPPCPAARPGGCGGCDWQHARPAAARRFKGEVLAEQLRRLAGVDRPVTVEELPGGPLGWRTRVRLAVGPSGAPGLHAHRSDRVVPIADCPIAVPGMLPDLLARRWTPGAEIEVVMDGAGRRHVTEIAPGRPPRRTEGTGRAVQHVGERRFAVAAHGFWQVHPALAGVLCEVVGAWSGLRPGGLAWDLYGGAGLFAPVLAEQAGPDGSVVVVEVSSRAVADGSAALADLTRVTLRAGRVEDELAELPGPPDVVVADPPRRGLGRELVDALAARGPGRLIYVACEPAALARDVALLAGHGYRLAELRAFDAFPMTHHLESVAAFHRD